MTTDVQISSRQRSDDRGLQADPRPSAWYRLVLLGARFTFLCTIRRHLLRPELAERSGGYVLALTHLGHIDPFCSCVFIQRPIRWMTRKEFFQFRITRWLLPKLGAFCVNRQGIPVAAIRRSIELAKAGEIVGICPEGGRVYGKDCVFRGGRIKQGVCSVAIRAGVSIVPCVMLGTPEMNAVKPWLPFKHGTIWTAYGEPIFPPPGPSNRAKRHALRAQLCAAYTKLYHEALNHFGLKDADIP